MATPLAVGASQLKNSITLIYFLTCQIRFSLSQNGSKEGGNPCTNATLPYAKHHEVAYVFGFWAKLSEMGPKGFRRQEFLFPCN